MKTILNSILFLVICHLPSAIAQQPSSMTLTAGNVYYFRLAAPSAPLDALSLWQTPGFISALNPTGGDDLFFPQPSGALTTVFHYNDGTYTGWVNNAFVVITNTPNAFVIISKRSSQMIWSLPPGTHYYGSDLVASTNWVTDFRSSIAATPIRSGVSAERRRSIPLAK